MYLKDNNSSEIIETGEVLYIGYGSKVSEIMFADKNPKISRVILEGTAYIKGYSFIAQYDLFFGCFFLSNEKQKSKKMFLGAINYNKTASADKILLNDTFFY